MNFDLTPRILPPNLLQVQLAAKISHKLKTDRFVRPTQGGVSQLTSKTSPSAPYTKTLRLLGKGFADDAECRFTGNQRGDLVMQRQVHRMSGELQR